MCLPARDGPEGVGDARARIAGGLDNHLNAPGLNHRVGVVREQQVRPVRMASSQERAATCSAGQWQEAS